MDPFQIIDGRFRDYILPIALLEKLHTGMRWAEGPVYFADGRMLIWSDVPNSRMLRLDEESGHVSVFRADSRYSNGNARDGIGRLITCEHKPRCVSRTEWDGTVVTLVDRYEGKRLNSPNDVVVKSDGTIWFTDPTYGISADYEGGKAAPELPTRNVFRFDPKSGDLRIVVDDFVQPNGLAFSPDEKILYVADSGFWPNPADPHHIRAFDVAEDGRLHNSRVLTVIEPGVPDGFRVDRSGNLWTSAGDGVHCITAEGELIGKIHIPEKVANVAFGGASRNRLYICGHTSLYAIFLNTSGAQLP